MPIPHTEKTHYQTLRLVGVGLLKWLGIVPSEKCRISTCNKERTWMSSNHTDPAFCKEHYQKATGWSPWNHWYHHFPHAEWDIRHQIKLNHLRYVEIVGMLTGATLNHPFHHVRALIDKHIKNGLNLINPDTFKPRSLKTRYCSSPIMTFTRL